MTTVPVLWVSWHEEILARGYADQAVLEAILDRTLWRPPDPLTFEHHEVRGAFPDVEGALVVLPSRHHVGDEVRFARELNRLDWAVVCLTSEEEWDYDWRTIVETDTLRLWVWQPRPEHESVTGKMPCGWYPGTREALAGAGVSAGARPLDWFFGGQITHERRHELVQALKGLPSSHPGLLIETEGFFQGVPFAEYVAHHAEAKVSPCPSGPESLCTARLEEALEAGAIPLADLRKPHDPQFDYWALLFGEYPFPALTDWSDLAPRLEEALDDWPRLSNRCSAWWQARKRTWAHQLDRDLRAVSGLPRAGGTPDDLVTVIIPTSPVPANPDASHLVETVDSIRAQLPGAEIIVVADGVRPEQEGQRGAYEEYLRAVCWACNFRWLNVVPLILDEWGHQANATRAALELVTTPLVLFCEHDTPLTGEIDWEGLCAFTLSGEANAVRFAEDVAVHPDHEAGMLDHDTRWWNGYGDGTSEFLTFSIGLPVRRTGTWWQRPHLARADFYRRVLHDYFTPESRTMIEDLLYGVVSTDLIERGEAAWWDWRLWLYCPEDDETLGFKRHRHLDARGDQPKYPMRFE